MRFHQARPFVAIPFAVLLLALAACGTRGQDRAQAPAAQPGGMSQPPASQPGASTQPPAPQPGGVNQAPSQGARLPAPAEPERVVPARTPLKVALARGLATDKDHAGDAWEGTLAEPVQVEGRVVWPKGAPVRGVVTRSEPAGRLKGQKGGLELRATRVDGLEVETGTFLAAGATRGKRNTEFIGGGAALGALMGALTGHRGAGRALGGAAVGAAAGTGLAAATADTVVRIPAGKVVTFTLAAPRKVGS